MMFENQGRVLSVLARVFAIISKDLLFRKPPKRCAWRHLNRNGNSTTIGGSLWGQQPTKHFEMVPLNATRVLDSDGNGKSDRLKYIFLTFDDNHYIIHTHHAWSSNKCTQICWLAPSKHFLSSFDTTYQQTFAHIWGPIVMGLHSNVFLTVHLCICTVSTYATH